LGVGIAEPGLTTDSGPVVWGGAEVISVAAVDRAEEGEC
jgi:hypothetical protein